MHFEQWRVVHPAQPSLAAMGSPQPASSQANLLLGALSYYLQLRNATVAAGLPADWAVRGVPLHIRKRSAPPIRSWVCL